MSHYDNASTSTSVEPVSLENHEITLMNGNLIVVDIRPVSNQLSKILLIKKEIEKKTGIKSFELQIIQVNNRKWNGIVLDIDIILETSLNEVVQVYSNNNIIDVEIPTSLLEMCLRKYSEEDNEFISLKGYILTRKVNELFDNDNHYVYWTRYLHHTEWRMISRSDVDTPCETCDVFCSFCLNCIRDKNIRSEIDDNINEGIEIIKKLYDEFSS